MSREEDFTNFSQKRWFAIAGIYWPPYRFTDSAGVEHLSVQQLRASDAESEFMMHNWMASKKPAPFELAELIEFITSLFVKLGRPKQGLIILPSVWRSTEFLFQDEVTCERVIGIYNAGICLPEMSAGDRYEIALHVQSLGLELVWEEDQIPNLDELIDH